MTHKKYTIHLERDTRSGMYITFDSVLLPSVERVLVCPLRSLLGSRNVGLGYGKGGVTYSSPSSGEQVGSGSGSSRTRGGSFVVY